MIKKVKLLIVVYLSLALAGCGAGFQLTNGDESGGYRAVTYDEKGELFLAVGTDGRLDAIDVADNTGLTIELPTKEDLLCILADDNIILIGGAGGVIVYSEDETFLMAETDTTSAILDITAFDDKYFACSENGTLLSSEDGKKWRRQKFSDGKDIIGIAALGENIMAITSDSDFYVSKDGTDWSFQNFNEYYDGYFEPLVFKGIEAIDDMFFVFGYFKDSEDDPFLIRSLDGNVWMFVPITELNFSTIEEYAESNEMPKLVLNSIAPDNEQILAACDNGYVLTVSNCNSCHKLSELLDVDLHGIAFGNNKFIAVGEQFKFDVFEAVSGEEYQISAEQANEYIQEGAIVIDICTTEEMASGSIKGSLRIPLDEINAKLPTIAPDINTRIIFYCEDNDTAQSALEIAVKHGYKFVYNLREFPD